MDIFQGLVSILLLFFGRKLFWFFVATLGFFLGFSFAQEWLGVTGDALIILGLVLGLMGALLAVFVQKLAIGVAGFLAGGYITLVSLGLIGIQLGNLEWIAFLVGGLLGSLLLSQVFEVALVFLTAFTGASLMVDMIHWNKPAETALFVLLIAAGILVQMRLPHRSREPNE